MHDIEEVRKIAEKYHDDWGYKYHILQVVKNALFLADKVGADKEVIEVAAYLHDLGVSKKIAGGSIDAENDHHITGANEARRLLSEMGYEPEFIQKVTDCILTHRGRKGSPPITAEQKVISNADAMAHFDSFLDLFRYFLVKKEGSSFEKEVEVIYQKMKRDWEKKLTIPAAREAEKGKYGAIMLLLESMRAQF